MNFLSTIFYSLPDASKILLDQARQFDSRVKAVSPHSYHSQHTSGSEAGAVGVGTHSYFNLLDFDHDTNIAPPGHRLFYGDLLISLYIETGVMSQHGVYISVDGYKSNGQLASPYGHIIYQVQKENALGQLAYPETKLFQLSGVWLYGIDIGYESDANGELYGTAAVTFSGFKFSR